MKYILFIFLVITFASGCYYDHADIVYPQSAICDTTSSTYSASVVPILTNNCYSCHSGTASAGAGIKLDTYTNVKVYITNGQLLNSINQNGIVPAMPIGASKLAACDINKIASWINKGSLNN